MATREERMRQRLRGAARHEVEDISFGLFAPEPEPDNEEGDAAIRTTPKAATPSTAKRSIATAKSLRPPSRRSSSAVAPSPSLARISPRRSDPYEIISETEEEAPRDGDAKEEDDVALLPPQPAGRRSVGARRSLGSSDVVQESPVHAPGSGRRLGVDTRGMRSSAQRLHRMFHSMDDDDEELMISSPLARKSRQSGAAVAETIAEQIPRPIRLSRAVVPDGDGDDVDELSPNATRISRQDDDHAEEIDDAEAARVLGRKRPRRSTARKSSPLLGSQDEIDGSPRDELVAEEVVGEVAERDTEEFAEAPELPPAEEPPPKRRRKESLPSPAKQRQPVKKPRAPRRKKREKAASARRPDDGSADEMGNTDAAVIPITVQRFSKPRRPRTGEDDADILAADIPFSNQKGVNVVDVLAQSSEEVIGTCIEQLASALQSAEASSARKELRVKIKALEAFGEEVRTRLLTHTIMLDNLYSLRQRVREAEMTRNKLRDSIMRHREEQEQLHIRMDAERDTHDENRKFLASRMEMSTDLHAIRQAIEQGKTEEATLDPAEVLKANLAMLEVNVPDLASKVCRTSDRGGLMQQVLRFNGFLERAAVELERQPRTSGSRILA